MVNPYKMNILSFYLWVGEFKLLMSGVANLTVTSLVMKVFGPLSIFCPIQIV